MKNKLLVLMCALSMTMLAACGSSDNAKSSSVENPVIESTEVIESSEEVVESTQEQETEAPTTEPITETEEIEEVDVVIEYVQTNFLEITIGEEQTFGDAQMEGEEYSLNDTIKFKVSGDWVLTNDDPWAGMMEFAYKGEMFHEKLVYFMVNGFLSFEPMTQEEFYEDMKNRIKSQYESDDREVTMVNKVNISGYDGYSITTEISESGMLDFICTYVLIDDGLYQIYVEYNSEVIEPSIKEAGIASALENINTFVIE